MNKKKRTLYLLIAVVGIYAAIAIRFFLLSDKDDSFDTTTTTINTFNPTQYKVQEDFTIVNNYRDPFLGKSPVRQPTNARVKTSTPSREEVINDYYPMVNYLGIVSDTKGGKKVLSLKIESKEYVIREGSMVDSVQIISGDHKKMVISYKGKRKVINIFGQ